MSNYAIVKKGNHQYFLEQGAELEVPRFKATEGTEYVFDKILALELDNEFKLGTPFVENAVVVVKVLKQTQSPKKRGFKYKAKSRYRRTWGYRNLYTKIKVLEIKIQNNSNKQSTKTTTKHGTETKNKTTSAKANSSKNTTPRATKTSKTNSKKEA